MNALKTHTNRPLLRCLDSAHAASRVLVLNHRRALWPRVPRFDPRARRRCLYGAMAVAMSIQGTLTGCAGSRLGLESDPSVSFVCEGGTSFRVAFFDGQVRVTTSAASYDLDFRPSSIGRKYSSDSTVFIQDEERAVLIGAAGGPFKRCHEV